MIPFLVVPLEVLLVSITSDRFQYTKQCLLNEGKMHIGRGKPGLGLLGHGCFPVGWHGVILD